MSIRCIMKFGADGQGPRPREWSETHWLISNAALTEVRARVITMGNAAVDLRPSNVFLKNIVISRDDVRGDSLPITAGESAGGDTLKARSTVYAAGVSCDQPNSCLLLRARSGVLKRKSIFLAGVPDDAIACAPLKLPNFSGVPHFKTKLDAWKAIMTNASESARWGFGGLDASVTARRIRKVTLLGDAPSNVVVWVKNDETVALPPSGIVKVRGTPMTEKTAPKINGEWQVVNTVATGFAGHTGYELHNSTIIDPTLIKKLGTIEPVVFAYHPYDDIEVIDQTTRKRGGHSVRGRSR